jgi:hypothetical protein
MTEIEELSSGRTPGDAGPNGSDVAELIARAERLTAAQVRAIAGAVAWRWQPLTPPVRGSFAATRSEALAAAKASGRADAAASAMERATAAALASPGAQTTARRWSWAENGLAAVLIGVIGAIVLGAYGLLWGAIAFGVLAVAGGAVLLVYDSGSVARRRLSIAVEGAVLALVVRDLVDPEVVQSLAGPWSTVMRD